MPGSFWLFIMVFHAGGGDYYSNIKPLNILMKKIVKLFRITDDNYLINILMFKKLEKLIS